MAARGECCFCFGRPAAAPNVSLERGASRVTPPPPENSATTTTTTNTTTNLFDGASTSSPQRTSKALKVIDAKSGFDEFESAAGVSFFSTPTADSSKRAFCPRFSSKYSLGPVIGRGSTSTAGGTGKVFATKVITEEQLRGGQFSALAEQFETEISALRACRHPKSSYILRTLIIQLLRNIIELEDAVVSDGRLYLVMEHLVGGELFDYVVERGTLSEREASQILRHLASAVAYMHDKGIIHRDLKPENLLLTRKPSKRDKDDIPVVKIIDFGLSKILSEPSVVATSFLGTRGYLAPEMLKRQQYSKSVDMWALGVIAYILVCGCLPFDDDSSRCSSPVISRKFELRYPSWASKLSPQCKSFLASLLQINPKDRAMAREACNHPWLAHSDSVPNNVLKSPALLRHLPKTPKQQRRPNLPPDRRVAQHAVATNPVRRKNSF